MTARNGVCGARDQRKEPRAYRSAPQNVDAEQALLGAILVNNEAFYRVSDFLLPDHFFEPVHRRIYQVAGELIRASKVASPVTIKTFLPADLAIGDINLAQYVARLAAEATTIINAEDYGRTIYDLAIRRALIGVGEEMVNVAYDAPVDKPPRDQIEDAEKRLYDLAERGNYDSGFHAFETALLTAIDMASAAYQRDGHLSGLATGLDDLDRLMGGLQPSDLIILAGRPGMGKTSLATNVAFNIARNWRGEVQAGRHDQDGRRRRRRLLLAGNVVGAARHPHHRRAVGRPLVRHPPRPDHRRPVLAHRRRGPRDEPDAALCRPDRRPHHRPACRPGPAAEAPARPRPPDRRLYPAHAGLGPPRLGQPRPGSHRDHQQPQGAGQGT